MNKEQNTLQTAESAITTDTVLVAGVSYTLGNFQVLLNEITGDLRVIAHTSRNSLKIKPKSDNSIILHACRN